MGGAVGGDMGTRMTAIWQRQANTGVRLEAAGVFAQAEKEKSPCPHPVSRQWDAQMPARPVRGAQEQVIGEVERYHRRLIGCVLLELLLQAVGVIEHGRQGFLAQYDDDGARGLPSERNDVHGDVLACAVSCTIASSALSR